MKVFLTCLALLFSYFLSSQELDVIKIDSLQIVVSENSGNEKAKALYELSRLHLRKSNALALNFIDEAIEHITDNDTLKGRALFQRGMVHVSDGNDILAIRDIKESILLLEKWDASGTANAYYWLSRIHRRKGRFPEALNYGFSELEFRRIIKDSSQIAASMFDIGYTYDRMGEYYQAITWHKKALNYYSFSDSKPTKAWGTGLIGIAFDELNQYDSALYYNKLAIDGFIANNQKADLKTWYSNIGNTYIKLNDFENAELYTRKSLDIDMPIHSKSVTLINLGKIYLEKGQFKKAQKTLDSAMALVKKYDQKRFLSEVFYRYHELRKKENRYAEALEYYEKYKFNEDELLNEAKTEQIAELGIQYDIAEKEKLLLIQRAELVELDYVVQRRNFQIYGVLALILILGLVSYLVYSRQKIKNNQLMKEIELKEALVKIETQNKLQDQRLRISRDLHDNIGAQLTFVISSLDNLKYSFEIKDEKLTSKLLSISRFTTETIYELRDTIWAMNKNEISFEDLESRITNFIDKANFLASDTKFGFICAENLDKNQVFTSIEGMNLYRIIQEAVNNSTKHSKAKNITVIVEEIENSVVFIIKDDGMGFNIEEIEISNGIVNMKKRAHTLHAELQIISSPNEGTSVKLTMPAKM